MKQKKTRHIFINFKTRKNEELQETVTLQARTKLGRRIKDFLRERDVCFRKGLALVKMTIRIKTSPSIYDLYKKKSLIFNNYKKIEK